MVKGKRPNKQACIDIIVNKLDQGITFSDCFHFFSVKYSITERTFANYWKESKSIHYKHQQAINEAKLNNRIEREIKIDDKRILDKLEALKILTEIARNQIVSEKGSTNDTDRINAIKTINQMQGYDAPTRSEVSMNIDPMKFQIIPPDDQ